MRRSGPLLALLALVFAHGTALAQPAPEDPWTGMRRDGEGTPPPARPARPVPAPASASPAPPSAAAAPPARAAVAAVPVPRPRPAEAPAAPEAPPAARVGALPPPSNLAAATPDAPAEIAAPEAPEAQAVASPPPEPTPPQAASTGEAVAAPQEAPAQDAQVAEAPPAIVASPAEPASPEPASAAPAAVPAPPSSVLSLLSLADGVLTPASLTALAAFSPIGPAAAAPVNIPLPPPAAAQPTSLPPAAAPGVTAPLPTPKPAEAAKPAEATKPAAAQPAAPKPDAAQPASAPSAAPAASVAAPPEAVAPQTPSAAQAAPAPAAVAAPDLPVLPPVPPRPAAPIAQPQAPAAGPAAPVVAAPPVVAPVVAAPPAPAPTGAAPAVAAPAVPAVPPSQAQAPVGQVEQSPGSRRAPLWPQDLVRALRRVQDSMAQGSTDAVNAQRDIIARIEREFAAAEPAVWEDPHNARAAVTYFLSGGNPAVLRRMMDQQPGPALDPRLLRGTLAYLEGREDEALRQLKDIDARSLPASLGGQVALAQAALFLRKDPKKSAELLGVARVLAPGTLVEEAALRRAILVAAQMNDMAQFEYLSRQYLFRFRNSVYAGNFRQRFAAALSRMGFGNQPDQLQRLEQMLEMLEPESRRDMELTLARAAVVQGRTTTASFAAERALSTTPDGSADAERARLYRGASMAPSAQTYGEALSELKAIDRDRLAPADLALLDAASATAENVKRATDNAATQPLPAAMGAVAAATTGQVPGQAPGQAPAQAQPPAAAAAQRPQDAAGPLTKEEMLPVLDRARAALANADASLKGGPR